MGRALKRRARRNVPFSGLADPWYRMHPEATVKCYLGTGRTPWKARLLNSIDEAKNPLLAFYGRKFTPFLMVLPMPCDPRDFSFPVRGRGCYVHYLDLPADMTGDETADICAWAMLRDGAEWVWTIDKYDRQQAFYDGRREE